MSNKGKNPIEIKKEIQKLMWLHAGVVRNSKVLKKGLQSLQHYKRMKFKVTGNLKMNEKLIAALDVQNMIPICEMIFMCALMRKESRAAHYREDYLKTDSKWKKNIIIKPAEKGFKLFTKPIRPIPNKIKKFIGYKKPKTNLLE